MQCRMVLQLGSIQMIDVIHAKICHLKSLLIGLKHRL